jgi:tetratricopeptide (TPR) repeat protein
MLKKIFLLSVIVFTVHAAKAQQPIDPTYDKYVNFNLARLQGEVDKLLEMGEAILPDAGKLPEKARINFYFSIGQVYEHNDQPQKALEFYEKVAAAVPDYYVAHRGIGYIYLTRAIEIHDQMHASTDAAAIKKLNDDYEKMARKALPHLEKAQACDASDETLDYIKTIYTNLKDTDGLNGLDRRLKQLSLHCIDILEDK